MNDLEKILLKYWNYSKFRPLQEEIIRSVVDEKKDTLALLPTGGGKSILYQVSGLSLNGLCIVITPLIALMKDQVQALNKIGIPAAAIYSGLLSNEINNIFNHIQHNAIKFLYVSPERLSSDVFKENIRNIDLGLIAIDESHCISQWGYDFRPSYLKISELREQFPEVPLLAVTATATKDVVIDIQKKLNFKEQNIFRKSFARENLVYVVRNSDNKEKFLINALKSVQGTAIVYARSRKKTETISHLLNQNGISSEFYHAGIEIEAKDFKQKLWTDGRIRVIVATNAFGMGIDKSNVRLVVHIDIPDSIEAYFQEAGRAGRDGKKAFALLIYNKNDEINCKKRVDSSFPKIEFIKRVYEALGNYFQLATGAGEGFPFTFNLFEFCLRFSFPMNLVYSSLKILQGNKYIEFSEEINNPTRIKFRLSKEELYNFQVQKFVYDDFVKIILRSYPGIFTDYVKIQEGVLAKRFGKTVNQIKKLLMELSSMKVITYIPKNSATYITYTEPRLAEKSVIITKESYGDRKIKVENKLNAMLAYASSQTKCRNMILLHYFSDDSAQRCGKCDICQRMNELNLSKYEFDIIIDEIKLQFKNKNSVSEDIINDYIASKNPKYLKVFEWLLENSKISRKENQFTW